MRVALDATAITSRPSGARTRLLSLYRPLARMEAMDLTVFVRKGAGLTAPFQEAGASVSEVEGNMNPLLRRKQASHPAARHCDDPSRFQLFAAETLPLPAMARVSQIATLHDLRFLRPGLSTLPRRFFGRFLLRRNLLRARAVVTVSAAMKKELLAVAGKKPLPPVHVVPNGKPDLPALNEEEARSRVQALGVKGPFILYLGHLEARKNLERLVHAFFRFSRAHEKAGGISLVLAGRAKKNYGARILACVAAVSRGLGEIQVHLTGEVDEETRAALLCKAFAAVQPSLYEGFNLGLLEAMAAGLPLVCSRIPAHEEVGGDGVSYFAPDSADELAQALEEAVFDENRRRELSKKGQMRAERFSWQTSAAQLREIWFAEER